MHFPKLRLGVLTVTALLISACGHRPSQTQQSSFTPLFKRIKALSANAFSGYTPEQLRHAYGVDKVTADGTGITIAIIDAYDAPNISTDFTAFSKAFGLPSNPSQLTVAYPQGKPAADSGWATEASLDVEWAHAIAPQAKLLLVLAKSASNTDLYGAVDYAVQQGAKIVSMSFGGPETSSFSTTSDQAHFGHPGVTFIASSGDAGVNATISNYPASSAFVVGVGGTSLSLDAQGNTTNEVAWTSGGGGMSEHVALPSYQTAVAQVLQPQMKALLSMKAPKPRGNKTMKRLVPDIALDADPNTGAIVYYLGKPIIVGGTSLAAPMFAGAVALLNQVRGDAGKAPIADLHTLLYDPQKTASVFHDVTQGCNSTIQKPGITCAAKGYDEVTGNGSVAIDQLLNVGKSY